ncbi:MAG: hypothetical protein AAF449_22935, partial [Myxococcota bacterium]
MAESEISGSIVTDASGNVVESRLFENPEYASDWYELGRFSKVRTRLKKLDLKGANSDQAVVGRVERAPGSMAQSSAPTAVLGEMSVEEQQQHLDTFNKAFEDASGNSSLGSVELKYVPAANNPNEYEVVIRVDGPLPGRRDTVGENPFSKNPSANVFLHEFEENTGIKIRFSEPSTDPVRTGVATTSRHYVPDDSDEVTLETALSNKKPKLDPEEGTLAHPDADDVHMGGTSTPEEVAQSLALAADTQDGLNVIDLTGDDPFSDVAEVRLSEEPPVLLLDLPPDSTGAVKAVEIEMPASAGGAYEDHLKQLSLQWQHADTAEARSGVLAEIATTKAILEQHPEARMVWGAESKVSNGVDWGGAPAIDQVWVVEPATPGEKPTYIFAEAQGGGSGLATDTVHGGRFNEMSDEWILSELVKESQKNGRTAGEATGILEDLGVKYQGYGWYEKDASGKWTATGNENYVISDPGNASANLQKAVVRDNFTGTGPLYSYDTSIHGTTTQPASFTFSAASDVVQGVHIPDKQLGSLHQMMMDSSPEYRSQVEAAIADGGDI